MTSPKHGSLANIISHIQQRKKSATCQAGEFLPVYYTRDTHNPLFVRSKYSTLVLRSNDFYHHVSLRASEGRTGMNDVARKASSLVFTTPELAQDHVRYTIHTI